MLMILKKQETRKFNPLKIITEKNTYNLILMENGNQELT